MELPQPSTLTKPSSTIFLSHNSHDKDFVRRLAGDLSRYGVKFWLDEAEIQIGDSLIGKIEQGISDMDYIGVVLSPESVNSQWVKREVEIALTLEIGGKEVRVLPLLYKKCEIPAFLRGKAYADFTLETEYENSLFKVLRRLGINDPQEVAASTVPPQALFASSSGKNPLISFESTLFGVAGRLRGLEVSVDDSLTKLFFLKHLKW